MNKGHFGVHGGTYIPETLMNAIIELEKLIISINTIKILTKN